MSYEYKDDINMMIFANPGKDLMKSFKMRDELDHVYAQAAKADEYEAKAKAFDEMSFVFVDSLANDYDDHSIVQNIAKVIENESGGYDAKK